MDTLAGALGVYGLPLVGAASFYIVFLALSAFNAEG